jgi:chromate reductase, NAD(P)H dehydrogenase (quinone)
LRPESPPPRILGISGSLRRDSHNMRLLAAAARLLPDDVEFVRFDGLKAVPPFDEDDEGVVPAGVVELRRWLAWADGILVATPEYNSSVPGQLKNAVDWASRPVATAALRNKNAVVIGASTGIFGAVWAQAELRKTLAAAGARVLDRELAVGLVDEQFTDAGHLAEPELERELSEIVTALIDQIRTGVELRAAA